MSHIAAVVFRANITNSSSISDMPSANFVVFAFQTLFSSFPDILHVNSSGAETKNIIFSGEDWKMKIT